MTEFDEDLPQEADFLKIVLNEVPLIDVRAPVEYETGAFPFSANLPLMNNTEREQVGICYKEQGHEAAVALGHQLVNEPIRAPRIEAWQDFMTSYPHAMLYCFRGGMRSKIAQQWLQDASVTVPRLKGGYKAFRQYLIGQLERAAETLKTEVTPVVLSGPTGSGKTRVLYHLENAIDLEGIAHHRGSAFGRYATPQPTQINFENALAYQLIQTLHQKPERVIFEDEGRNIGSLHLPKTLFEAIKTGPKSEKVIVETPLEQRLAYTLEEYVEWGQQSFITLFGEVEAGLLEWEHQMRDSLQRIQKRLGGERYQRIVKAFEQALQTQEETNDLHAHEAWIRPLLTEYYDPMYAYQLEKNQMPILFRGSPEEVIAFFQQSS